MLNDYNSFYRIKDLETNEIIIQTQDPQEILDFILPQFGKSVIYDPCNTSPTIPFQKEWFSNVFLRDGYNEAKKGFKSNKYSLREINNGDFTYINNATAEDYYNDAYCIAKAIYDELVELENDGILNKNEIYKQVFGRYNVEVENK